MAVEIISKLREGDHESYRKVYELFHQKVFGYFLSKTKNEEDAADLTQQSFIKLWKYRNLLTTTCTIEQQIFQKCRQVFIDWLRVKATERKHIDDSADVSLAENQQHVVISFENSNDLESSLNHLPPQRRKVFELKHKQGYSYKEIAHRLGISVKTVDNHLMKATAQLRKQLNL